MLKPIRAWAPRGRGRTLAAFILALWGLAATARRVAQTGEEFYKGKTISVMIGYGVGGRTTYGRA